MIRAYSDHAANERTFLAWVRTGIAIIALGFVIEKFNVFLLTIAATLALDMPQGAHLKQLSGPLGRYGGLALILGGVGLILLSALRFWRTGQRLSAPQEYAARSVARSEYFLLMAIVAFVAIFAAYLALA